MGKEVQKRWRSIRDSYTKAFRQGKCVLPENCQPGSRRHLYHKQMSFLLKALQNKKPRYSQDKYESLSEVSNSPQNSPPEDLPKDKIVEKPIDLNNKTEKPETQDKCNQATIGNEINDPPLEITTDPNSILPGDNFNDDQLFLNSILPLFKNMTDDTRLLCRIEVLKIIRLALQGHECFEDLRQTENRYLKNKKVAIPPKHKVTDTTVSTNNTKAESTLSMTTRSADGSRPIRKRRARSPSPLPVPAKRRGRGRPRKVRKPSDSDSDQQVSKRRCSRLMKEPPVVEPQSEIDEWLSKATSVLQLSAPHFMKVYELKRSKSVPPESGSDAVKGDRLERPRSN